MKNYLFIIFLVLQFPCFVFSQRNDYKIKKDSVKYPNEVFIGDDFYLFEKTESSGFYPSFYNLTYRQRFKKLPYCFAELGWTYFETYGYLPFIWKSYVPILSDLKRYWIMYRIEGGGYIGNTMASVGLCYRYGDIQTLFYSPGVAWFLVLVTEDSFGYLFSLKYSQPIGKHFLIEPQLRYEYYPSGLTHKQYMAALHFGYRF